MWAKHYDTQRNPLIALEEPITLGLIGDVHGKRVLDLGCGTGRYSLELAALGAQVIGVDISAEMIGEARIKVTSDMDVQFVVTDISTELDLPSSSFDMVTSTPAMCHLPDISGVFSTISKVLVPHGFAVIAGQNPFLIQVAKVRTLFKVNSGYHYIEYYPHLFSEMCSLVVANGLEIEHIVEPTWNILCPDLGDIRPIPATPVLKLRKSGVA